MNLHKSVKALLIVASGFLVLCGTSLMQWAIRRRTQHLDAQKSAKDYVQKHIQ